MGINIQSNPLFKLKTTAITATAVSIKRLGSNIRCVMLSEQ